MGMDMRKTSLLLVDRVVLEAMFHWIRKAQGKLSQVKGGKEISDELSYSIRSIEILSYNEGDAQLAQLMDQLGLTYIQEADEYKEIKSKLDRIREVLAE